MYVVHLYNVVFVAWARSIGPSPPCFVIFVPSNECGPPKNRVNIYLIGLRSVAFSFLVVFIRYHILDGLGSLVMWLASVLMEHFPSVSFIIIRLIILMSIICLLTSHLTTYRHYRNKWRYEFIDKIWNYVLNWGLRKF